jgi:uncharacterized protein
MTAADQLRALVELQSRDTELARLAQEEKKARAPLAALEAKQAANQTELDRRTAELRETEARLTELNGLVAADKDTIDKWEKRLRDIHTPREYAGLQREIDGLRRNIVQNEEEVVRLTGALEVLTSEVDGLKAAADTLKTDVAQLAKQIRNALTDGAATAKKLEAANAATAKTVPLQLVNRYRMILGKRQQLAVVPVENRRCTGCNMQVSHQHNLIILRGQTIEACPACQRILYERPSLFPEEAAEAAAAADE